MIGLFAPLGFDDLIVPAYFDTGDAAALERWKREHPDWFEAGTWTPGRRARSDGSAIGDRTRPGTPPHQPGQLAKWEQAAVTPLDPESLSLADFQRVAAEARRGGSLPSQIVQAQYRGPAQGAPRFQGAPRTPAEEILEYRFYQALRTLQRLEPRNPRSDILRDPTRAPSEETVRALEQEARDAALRDAARVPAGASEPDPATPLQRQNLRREMVRQGFMNDESGSAAHHITPGGGKMSGDRDPGRAQAILRKFGIDLDGALNGVALSRGFHDRLHTAEYYRYVQAGLTAARSREEAITFLRRLAKRLQIEDVRFQKDNKMPTWMELRY